MVAVSEALASAPEFSLRASTDTGADGPAVPAHRRRVVAIAATAMELLRPESDLLRSIAGVPHVDLLVAAEDISALVPCQVGVLGPDACATAVARPAPNPRGSDTNGIDSDGIDSDGSEYEDSDDLDDDGDELDEVWAEVSRLGGPGLHVHRLGLSAPLSGLAEPDLIAALSELVGFDPEPGVYCLAPAQAPTDPGRAVIDRAVQRIAQVYGLPLLRYRCLELSVV